MSLVLEQERKTRITVKVVTMGKDITNYVADDSLTVDRLLEELGVDERMDVRVNGATVDKGRQCAHGDHILIVPKIRGGSV